MDMLLSAVLEDAIDDLMDDVIDSGEVEIVEDKEDGIFAHPQMEEDPEDVYEDPYIQDQYSDEEDEGEDESDGYVEYPVDATESDNDLDAIIDQLDSQIDGDDESDDDEDDIFVDEASTLKSEGSLYTLEDSATSFEEYERFVNESFLLNNTIYIGDEYIKEDGIFQTIIEKVKKIIEWLWDKIISLVDMIKTKILEFVTGQSKLTELIQKFRAAKIDPDDIPDQIVEESAAVLEDKKEKFVFANTITQKIHHFKVSAVDRAAAANYIDKAIEFDAKTLIDSVNNLNDVTDKVKTGCGFDKNTKLDYEKVGVYDPTIAMMPASRQPNESATVESAKTISLNEARNNQPNGNNLIPTLMDIKTTKTIEYIIYNKWFKSENEKDIDFKTLLASKNEVCDQYVGLMKFISSTFKNANKAFKNKKKDYGDEIKKIEKAVQNNARMTQSIGDTTYDTGAEKKFPKEMNKEYGKLKVLREAANIHTYIIKSELNAIDRCIITEYKYVRNTLVDLMTFSGFIAKNNIKINSLIIRNSPFGAGVNMDPMDVNYRVTPSISNKGQIW